MTENIETIEKSINRIHEELKEISKKTGIKTKELLPLMTNRELVIINTQLRAIHEHLNRIDNQKQQSKKEVA